MAITVGSVEVDVIPNVRGIEGRLRAGLVPPANRIGDELGHIIGQRIAANITTAVRDGITAGGNAARPAATRQGSDTGSTFARSFKTRLEAALRNLPEVRLNANSTDAEREIAQIRSQLAALRDVRIGIDVSAADASVAMTRLQERLDRLSASDANVQVRVDAGAASAQLAAFQAEVNRLDGQTANVDVDTRSATANLNLMTSAAVAFGPALLPVLPVVAAGLGSIAAAAVAAGVGLGSVALVALPAFKQISGVLQAQKAAQDAAAQSTASGGQASARAASRSLQLASAQQAVAAAERNGARQIEQAQQAVTQARQNAAQVAVQASQRTQQAARAVSDAEKALTASQRDARRAQEDLTAARKQAAQELEDLNNRLTDSVLGQRDAEIALKEAAQQRDAVLKDPKSTELDRQKAILQYDEAVQRLKEQTTETSRLKNETAAANKAGVKGSATYKAAQDKVAQAQQAIADKTQALKDAQAAQAQTAQKNAQEIAAAQQRIADAQTNVATAQQNAADSAASAQRQLQQAQQQTVSGTNAAATAQAKYRAELAKLSPSARDTFNAFLDLRRAFGDWSKSLQPAVMPIFTRALVGLKNVLPQLTPLVVGAADAIKELMDRAGAELKKPFWKGFKDDLDKSVKPAIVGFGIAFGNIFTGIAGIVDAFLPHMDGFSGGMQKITGKFADWGKNLKGSPEFERFLAYSAKMAPVIWDGIRKISGAVLSLLTAMEPISTFAYQVIGVLATGISWIADKLPFVVQGIWAIVLAVEAWKLAMWVWSGVTWLASAALTAFNLVAAAGPWGWVALAIGVVVVAVVLLWKHCAWFRDAVKVVWDAIKIAAKAVVDWFAGPFASFFTKKIPSWFNSTLTWVKSNWPWILGALTGPIGLAVVYIIKHWDKIRQGLSDGWSWIKKNVLSPIGTWFTRTVPGWASSLADKVVGAFDTARAGIKLAWDKIKDITKVPVKFVIDTVYNGGIVKVWNMVATAFGAPPLGEFHPKGFASGGVLPGYSPGKDVHKFYSPTGGGLELSGGEAIMRPEFTRAVGSGFVGAMNSIAKSRGSQGVKAALAPVFGGNPMTPTDTTLRYKDGGIFGWIGSAASAVKGVGSDIWNSIKKGASWLKDTLAGSARAGIKHVVDPLLARFPGMDSKLGQMIRRMPNKIIDSLFGYSETADKKGGSGLGGPKIQKALSWAKTQAGLPYQWAGNGNPSWDCSGFMSAIESVIRGQKPHRRWATGAFSGKTAPPGWVYHGESPFRIGITNAGVGHTAGTLGKTNVESRGGAGVVVGKGARGYKDSLFSSWYGFQPGKYDSGGYLQPGLNLAYNGTGRPEPVFTRAQAKALTSMAARPAGADLSSASVNVWIGDEPMHNIARAEIRDSQQQLISVLNAN
ncbi:hypothetical protein [Streptomyces mirabilis]|uniref:hypothetical protein n=1 Tax=Streptomyces mirabilis TaxID=68239 RepID=UPI0036809F39